MRGGFRGSAAFAIVGLAAVCSAAPRPAAAAPARALTLAQSVELALRQNSKLKIRRIEERAVRLSIAEQRGGLWPTLSSQINFRHETNATPYSYINTGLYSEKTLRYRVGLEGLFPLETGLRYGLNLESSIAWSDLDVVTLSPRHTNLLQLSLTQPLLRGLGRHTVGTRVEASRADHGAALAEVEAEISAVLAQVARAYWQLVARQQELEIARAALQLASEQQALAAERVRIGTLSKFDLLESQTKVAVNRQRVAATKADLLRAETGLLREIEATGEEGARRVVRAADAFQSVEDRRELEALVATAMRQRPELRALADRQRAVALRSKAAANAALPRLDVEGAVGLASLSGNATCTVATDPMCLEPNPDLVGGHDLAYAQLFKGKLPYWQVGVLFELPLSSDVRRAEQRKSENAERRLRHELQQATLTVAMEVRDAYHGLRNQQQQLAAAKESVGYARSFIEAAQRKFKGGLGTTADVHRAQDALVSAERELVRIRQTLMISRVELEAAIGALPRYLGVEIN